jgi:hypothetical protein
MPRAKRSTVRDAPTETAPKARAKDLRGSLERAELEVSTGLKPPRARVGARYGAHPST